MRARQLLFPEDIKKILIKRYAKQHRDWLANDSIWPLELSLGSLTEREALQQPDAVRDWVHAWRDWRGHGELKWREIHWRSLGKQQLPERLVLLEPLAAAAWAEESILWKTAFDNYYHLISLWPQLSSCLPRYFATLAECDAAELMRIEKVLTWLIAHPHSNFYPRQLPIAGIDSKWIEKRKSLITQSIATLQQDSHNNLDFYQRCGLRQPPTLIRLRVLDPKLCQHVRGLSDITAPLQNIADLNLPVATVFIVENLQTGLAFAEYPQTIIIMGLGNNIAALLQIPWLLSTNCIYWGDIDTHGFAILHRARVYLPKLKSIMMDEETLLQHERLWGREQQPNTAETLSTLTTAERDIYQGLKQHRWAINLRLEQERISWDYAVKIIETHIE